MGQWSQIQIAPLPVVGLGGTAVSPSAVESPKKISAVYKAGRSTSFHTTQKIVKEHVQMSKKGKLAVQPSHESGAHGGNTLGRESGAHRTKKHPELKQAKESGRHETGKTHHETTTRRDENKPQATPAKQLFAEVK